MLGPGRLVQFRPRRGSALTATGSALARTASITNATPADNDATGYRLGSPGTLPGSAAS
jgi:hypothetical protein